jgi:hypothetical protein
MPILVALEDEVAEARRARVLQPGPPQRASGAAPSCCRKWWIREQIQASYAGAAGKGSTALQSLIHLTDGYYIDGSKGVSSPEIQAELWVKPKQLIRAGVIPTRVENSPAPWIPTTVRVRLAVLDSGCHL